jgi:hypothetical protein
MDEGGKSVLSRTAQDRFAASEYKVSVDETVRAGEK